MHFTRIITPCILTLTIGCSRDRKTKRTEQEPRCKTNRNARSHLVIEIQSLQTYILALLRVPFRIVLRQRCCVFGRRRRTPH